MESRCGAEQLRSERGSKEAIRRYCACPQGLMVWAAGGSCDIGERREVCSDKHLSGDRARTGQAGLGRQGWAGPRVTMLVMGVGEGAGCRRSLGLYGCNPTSDALLLLSEPLALL